MCAPPALEPGPHPGPGSRQPHGRPHGLLRRSRPARGDRPLCDARRHAANRRCYRPALGGVRGRDEALLGRSARRRRSAVGALRRAVHVELAELGVRRWNRGIRRIRHPYRRGRFVLGCVRGRPRHGILLRRGADARPEGSRARLSASRAPRCRCALRTMDQLASALGIAGHALRIDCGTIDVQPVRLPAGVGILVLDSAVPRRLEHTAYAKRRAEVERGHPGRIRHVESENERVDTL